MKKREIKMSLPHIAMATQVLKNSEELLTLPRKSLQLLTENLPIDIYEVPFEVPHFDITLIWHERTHQYSPHQWLRKMITNLNFID